MRLEFIRNTEQKPIITSHKLHYVKWFIYYHTSLLVLTPRYRSKITNSRTHVPVVFMIKSIKLCHLSIKTISSSLASGVIVYVRDQCLLISEIMMPSRRSVWREASTGVFIISIIHINLICQYYSCSVLCVIQKKYIIKNIYIFLCLIFFNSSPQQ